MTLRIFVGRAGAARLTAGEPRYAEAYRSASIEALANSMIALAPQGRVVAVAESGSLAYVLGRTGGLPLQPGGHSSG